MAATASVTPVTAADATFSAAGSAAWAAGMSGPVTVDNNTLAAAKLAASATDVVVGRSTAGAGAGEEIACTAAGRALIDDADAGAQRTTLGVGTADSPQFTAVNIGHASDTTVSRVSAGDIAVEGNAIYRAGGTDVPVADGGTGGSDAATARANLAAGLALQTTAFTALSPADASTIYCGSLTPGTTAGIQKIYIPRAGTVKAVYIAIVVAGTLGSNETSTISFRLNDTTDTTISSAVTADALTRNFSNASLSIAVSAGNSFELKWVTPTWATNPTSVFLTATVYIE